ncbi:hypothetical protein A6302_04155 [Methylobrevis pamukkalensis]|uniref:Fibronectin type-III domain-containing protein n=1 Tax=Methylobrevis pamukkalensis TaxID=1439726 RepID=A0A1E3GWV5_9HYPH|nr:hypothetical protein A6302_04155 [Methylobrevis pamukkalensis]
MRLPLDGEIIRPGGGLDVLAMPVLDAGRNRTALTLPAGLTVAEIVAVATPDLPEAARRRMRVLLVTERGTWAVTPEIWHRVRPRPGVQVVIRPVAEGNFFRNVLQILVVIAAVALGQFYAVGLAGSAFGTALGLSEAAAGSLITLGATVVGNLLINALVPPQTPDNRKASPSYGVSGWRNPVNPDGVLPQVMGTMRIAPPFIVPPYWEIVGGKQYNRGMLGCSLDEIEIDDIRLGETPIGEFDEVQMEIRTGAAGDAPVTLTPEQVIQEEVGSQLRRELPRDDDGEVTGEPAEDQPLIRYARSRATKCKIILFFPGGLSLYSVSRGRHIAWRVQIRIEQKLLPTGTWEEVDILDIDEMKREPFWLEHEWGFGVRGAYAVRLTRLTDESEDNNVSDQVHWQHIQTFRPEYPLNTALPVSVLSFRMLSTYQINGQVDSLNMIARRVCLDWDAETETWVRRATRNPASLYRYALQSPGLAKPVADSGIDLDQLAEWHEWCVLKGLTYDRVHDFDESLEERLRDIAAAGRASPQHDGRRWGVVIDRPQSVKVDHISPRNARSIAFSRTYTDPPHAFRVKFRDAANDYEWAERIVPWPGFTGTPTILEAIEFPWITDADRIWIEARRMMYVAKYRPDLFSAMQDVGVRTSTRGDLVGASLDLIDRRQMSARVSGVRGNLVEIDDTVTMEAGTSYAIEFRARVTSDDPVGVAVVRLVATVPGDHSALRMLPVDPGGADDVPEVGGEVHFGVAGNVTFDLILKSVESGEGFTQRLTFVEASPIIDELTDAEEPPAWDGNVGEIIVPEVIAPLAPVIASLRTGSAGNVLLSLRAAAASAPVVRWEARHRADGAPGWTTLTSPVASTVRITGYDVGDVIDLQARGLAADGTPGAWGTEVAYTVGAEFAQAPEGFEVETTTASISETTTGVLAVFSWSPGADDDTHEVQWQTWDGTTAGATSRLVADAGDTEARTGFLTAYVGYRARLRRIPDDDEPSPWTDWKVFATATAPTIADDFGNLLVDDEDYFLEPA